VISSDTIVGGIALDLTVEAIERVGAETFIYGTRQLAVQGVAANPGELPPGEVIVRIPGAIAPAIGKRIRAIAPRESCICSQPTAASGSSFELRLRHSGARQRIGAKRGPLASAPGMTLMVFCPGSTGACTPPEPCPYWRLTGRQMRRPAKMGRRKGPERQSRFERTL